MSKKEAVETVILENQKTGRTFSFVIKKGEEEKTVIRVFYRFFIFEPIPCCDYYVEVLSPKNGRVELVDELSFGIFDDLITFLLEKNVDPNLLRAVH